MATRKPAAVWVPERAEIIFIQYNPAVGDEMPDDRDPHLADPEGERRLDRTLDRLELDDALRKVPEEFRVPLVLRDVGDLDYSEIAATLGVPIGTVKSRIARGRAALAVALRAGNRDDPDGRPTDIPHDRPPTSP